MTSVQVESEGRVLNIAEDELTRGLEDLENVLKG